LQFQLQKFE